MPPSSSRAKGKAQEQPTTSSAGTAPDPVEEEPEEQPPPTDPATLTLSEKLLHQLLLTTTQTDRSSARKRKPLPDPKPFSGDDSDNRNFEDFLAEVRKKLRVDGPVDFPEEEDKIEYVQSLLEGVAADTLRPYTRDDSVDPILTVEDAFEKLIDAFRDANEEERARTAFQKLFYNESKYTSFQPFKTEFITLAQNARIPSSQWKSLLKRKVPDELKRPLWRDVDNPDVTFTQYVNDMGKLDFEDREEHTRLNRRNNARGPATSTTSRSIPRTSGTSQSRGRTSATPGSPGPPRVSATPATTARQKLTDDERTRLRATGACFRCRQPGHIASECPESGGSSRQGTPQITKLETGMLKEDGKWSSESEGSGEA